MDKKPIDTSNLTGGQIQEALDFLIYKGLEPIIRHSQVFDIQVAHLLGVAATNKKRKISALEREVFIVCLCNVLTTTDLDRKIDLLSKAKIERSFVYSFLVNFLSETEDYTDLYTKYLTCSKHMERTTLDLKLQAIERTVGFTRDHLFSTLNICRHYVELAYTFRNNIVEQYLKHGYKQAHAFCKQKTGNFDFKDVYQSLMAAITKAIDKYDSSKGALTSYINYWILNAQTYSNANYGHEYGIAYTMPQLQKRNVQGTKASQVNFSVSLDSVMSDNEDEGAIDLKHFLVGCQGVDRQIEDDQESATLLYLIKSADNLGIARLYLDLDEYISRKEKIRMLRSMKKQLGFMPTKGVESALVAAASVQPTRNCK
jgi:hypothetical protein